MVRFASLLAASLPLLVACEQPPPEEPGQDEVGVLSVPLTSTNGDGTYKLTGGALTLRRAGQRDPIEVITDLSADVITRTLRAGSYTVGLEDGWVLSQIVDGVEAPVEAVLISKQNQAFQVKPGRAVEVVFRFVPIQTEGEVTVGIGVNTGHWLSGTFTLDDPDLPGAPDWATEIFDVDIPFDIYFAVDGVDVGDPTSTPRWLTYHPSPARVVFGRTAAVLRRMEAALSGVVPEQLVTASYPAGGTDMSLQLSSAGTGAREVFELDFANIEGLPEDADGYAPLAYFEATTCTAFAQRYVLAEDGVTVLEQSLYLGSCTLTAFP